LDCGGAKSNRHAKYLGKQKVFAQMIAGDV
jgi:hypothetical protein